MASSPVQFLLLLLVGCIVGWGVFMFSARLVALLLSRIMKASVSFRVSGCNSVRDVTVKFEKGAIESVSVGEVKLSLRSSLVKLGFGFVSKDPKLQLLINDLEITTRHSKKGETKGRSHKSRSTSRGKWMVLVNTARWLSVSVTDLVVKMPKTIIEVKSLGLDLFKNGRSNPNLNVKLHFVPLLLHLGESKVNIDQPGYLLGNQVLPLIAEKSCIPFVCDDLSVDCEIGHDRELGIGIRKLDVASEDVTINVNEDLFLKKTTEKSLDVSQGVSSEKIVAKKSNSLASMKKLIPLLPEKITINLPRLDLKFMHQQQDFSMENNIMGIYLRSSKSHFLDDSGEATTHFDLQMDFSEIHLLKEGSISVLEILKVVVMTSIDVPMQPESPIRSEIDVKLGGTQCNLIVSRLLPLLHFQKSKKKKVVLQSRDRSSPQAKSVTTESKDVMWTCTLSAPEIVILLYDNNGLPLYHGCSQSSHLFANNIASKGLQIHAELGELHLYMADENHDYKENLFGVEANSGSLVHIARVSLDWGHKEMDTQEKYNSQLVFSVDVTGMGIYFKLQQVESLITYIMSLKALLPKKSTGKSENRVGQSSKPAGKGAHILKLNLEQCSFILSSDVGVEDATVADPKRVNFGSQGGEVIISVSSDGSLRQARIASSNCNDSKYLKNSTAIDISHLSLCVNKDKLSTRMELERAKSVYKEYSKELGPITEVTLFDIQNAKFVRRPGGPNENSICSLFSATDITLKWEPDMHLAFYEIMLRLKFILHNLKLKLQGSSSEVTENFNRKGVEQDSVHHDKQHKKKDSVFAVDVEKLRVFAELADGVDALVQVQSIFSENARIGLLLEGLIVSLNEARVLKSSRMQISRRPVLAKASNVTKWDWVIQGPDVHICLPFRLQLRAIDDAVEDTLRGLKLIIAAKTNILCPVKKDGTKKVKTGSSKLGSVKLCIRKLTADIEEEPIQGWFDEHHQLMKNEICELVARLKFFDDIISCHTKHSGAEQIEMNHEKIRHAGVDIDIHNLETIQRLQDEIHRKTFQSYYLACQRLVSSEGSGACTTGFQAGFKPSASRTSLLSLCATELDVTLTAIEGGNTGMIEYVKKLDAVALNDDIPFSRLYGRNMVLHVGSLAAQLRDFTFPLFSGSTGNCEGCVVLAQQATCFQPQIEQDIYIGRWRKVCVLRSASGTTPAVKMYSNLPIYFQKGELSFGVGYEPVFADISYAFTVALRRANLSVRHPNSQNTTNQPAKKERSLPWWDDMRYYIHGSIGLHFEETLWNIIGTTNPYEKVNKFQVVSGCMDIHQSDGRVSVSAKEFKVFLNSLECLMNSCGLKRPASVPGHFLYSSSFSLEVTMDWECESGNPLNHYLHALPSEGKLRSKVYDPFRSTSLSLRWNFSLRPCTTGTTDGPIDVSHKSNTTFVDSPIVNVGAHDLVWLSSCWNMLYTPPHKLRSFSRVPRFGVPRATRSGNLSLDKVMTEFFIRFDATPACIKNVTLSDDDPASSLTFRMSKLRNELCFSRGKQIYTFDCVREPLDLVYQGLDLFMLKAYSSSDTGPGHLDTQTASIGSQSVMSDRHGAGKNNYTSASNDKNQDDGFLLYSDYFTIRKQVPKADPARLLAWQESARKNIEMTYVRSEYENGSESDHTRSDPSDDDGFNVVIADNCQRVFIYGLKLLWTIENRDAVWSWVGAISKAFEPPKPSPSRQYAQRKLIDERQKADGLDVAQDDSSKSLQPATSEGTSPIQHDEPLGSHPSTSPSTKKECLSAAKNGLVDEEEEGTRHFMVNVIQPQFNLHSEEANGRFLLAAASGRVLARSFHSVLHVGYDEIEKALGADHTKGPETEPEVTWKRAEYSVMLEHVQAHVAPTDVDPGAGLQWLPKILGNSPKVKRTGALLERVFMPCQMYFRYTRHKGGGADLKVKPLKELTFNSPNITATMTSRQFQVMLDVLSNLLFARLPKPRKSSLSYPTEDEDIEEEIDEVVPDGVEEVELAKINLEQKERERKLLLDDIRSLMASGDVPTNLSPSTENDDDFWMITGTKSALVQSLKKELLNIQKSRKLASVGLRMVLQKAAQISLMEKEKNKSPSYAMRISMKINKVVWSMLADGKSFAEAEINNMIYDFDRDYKDIGVAQFTTKSFEVRNCLENAKSDMLLSPWNAPRDWGKKDMIRVDAKQGAPKDGTSSLDLLQAEIYPLRIHLAESMYRMMWEYFFPEEEQDSHRRQEVWKVSTTAGTKRGRKSASGAEAVTSNQSVKESDIPARVSATTSSSTAGVDQSLAHPDAGQTKLQSLKANIVCGSSQELQRTSSFDRTWGENVTEPIGNEIVLHVQPTGIASTKSGPINPLYDTSSAGTEDMTRIKSKDTKLIKSGRLSHEEKKVSKTQDEKRGRARKMMEFHNIKISQVELLVTYEGSRFAVSDLRLLMDTFHRVEFTGTWRRLFSRVKKHIIWSVLKSVTGMQGKKFKDKGQTLKEPIEVAVPDIDGFFSDSDGGEPGKLDQFPTWLRRPNDGAGDGFVTSIKGLFNTQRRKAKAFVRRSMKNELDNEGCQEDWSDTDVESPPFARQLTITKAKKLMKRPLKKFRSKAQRNSGTPKGALPTSPMEMTPIQSDSSGESSPDEDVHE